MCVYSPKSLLYIPNKFLPSVRIDWTWSFFQESTFKEDQLNMISWLTCFPLMISGWIWWLLVIYLQRKRLDMIILPNNCIWIWFLWSNLPSMKSDRIWIHPLQSYITCLHVCCDLPSVRNGWTWFSNPQRSLPLVKSNWTWFYNPWWIYLRCKRPYMTPCSSEIYLQWERLNMIIQNQLLKKY